jgi:hypothetical protein
MVQPGALATLRSLSTSDLIAIGAFVLTALGALAAYRQFKAGKDTARGQFLLDMDQAFEDSEVIRVRLGKHEQLPLSTDEWRQVKRYMAQFERVAVFTSEGLLDPEVVYRLYGSRFRNIIRNDEIRTRPLENAERAKGWTDFIQLWRKLDSIGMRRSGSHLSGVAPKETPWPLERVDARHIAAPDEEFEDES